jgi:hypothetical protein
VSVSRCCLSLDQKLSERVGIAGGARVKEAEKLVSGFDASVRDVVPPPPRDEKIRIY